VNARHKLLTSVSILFDNVDGVVKKTRRLKHKAPMSEIYFDIIERPFDCLPSPYFRQKRLKA